MIYSQSVTFKNCTPGCSEKSQQLLAALVQVTYNEASCETAHIPKFEEYHQNPVCGKPCHWIELQKNLFWGTKEKGEGFFYTFSEKNKFQIMKFYLSTLLLDDDLFFRSRLKIGRKFKGLLKKTNVTRFKLAHNNYFNNLSFDNHVFKTD